jgi:hypothetical protein
MANSNAGENGRNSRFSSDKQPYKRGRPKSKFGKLGRENNLSVDDIRKVYANILTSESLSEIDEIKSRTPTILVDQTLEMLRQDKLGRLTGRKAKIKIKTGEKDEAGKDIFIEKEIDERIKSYDTTRFMVEFLFGSPAKMDISINNNIDIEMDTLSKEENDERIKELIKELGYDQPSGTAETA